MIDEKEQVIKDLLFFKEKLYNGIFKDKIGVFDKAIKLIKQLKTDDWIPCSKELPEEKNNPITNDFYVYPVVYKDGSVEDIRYYGFGNGHWWHGSQVMDAYVVKWLPLYKHILHG